MFSTLLLGIGLFDIKNPSWMTVSGGRSTGSLVLITTFMYTFWQKIRDFGPLGDPRMMEPEESHFETLESGLTILQMRIFEASGAYVTRQ